MDSFAITEGLVPDESTQDGQESQPQIPSKLSEETTKFQRAIAAWRGKTSATYATGAVTDTFGQALI